VVLVGTPFDLGSKLRIDKPAIRVRYEMEDAQTEPHGPTLRDAVMERLLAHSSGGAR
jgi:predicted GTPase